MELEAEVAKLKEENEELQKKQVILIIAACHNEMQAFHLYINLWLKVTYIKTFPNQPLF
jgi:hypothetical protein